MLTPSPESLEESKILAPCDCPGLSRHEFDCLSHRQPAIALALDRRAERARREAWRPIETAPRDGTLILLAWGEDHVSTGAYVNDDADAHPWKFIDRNHGRPIFNGARDDKYGPTHWQPQPAAILSSPAPGGDTL